MYFIETRQLGLEQESAKYGNTTKKGQSSNKICSNKLPVGALNKLLKTQASDFSPSFDENSLRFRVSNIRAKFSCHCPGARFSKVPKLYGWFSGVTIPFVSQERRGFNSSNFRVLFLFVTLKTCLKISFQNKRDFRETGPRPVTRIWIEYFITIVANLAIWLANLPLSIRVHTTLLASMCRAMLFQLMLWKKKKKHL